MSSKKKITKLDSQVGVLVSSESDLGDIFVLSPLLYVANQFVSDAKSSLGDEHDLGSLIKYIRRHRFAAKEIKERLYVPVYAAEHGRKSLGVPKASLAGGKVDRWNVECGDSLIVAAELIYNAAPSLFSSEADKRFLRVLEGDSVERQVRAGIEALATNERCLTIAHRQTVAGTIRLKDFEWQEWLLRGLMSQRFRLLVRIRSNQGLFIQIQEELHKRMWRDFWFQRFLDSWLKTDVLETEIHDLKMPDVMGFIGRFWSEYFYPIVDPDDVYIQPQGNFFNKFVFAVRLRWRAHILNTARNRIKAAEDSIDRRSELSKALSKFATDAKLISESDLLAIRMNPDAANALGLTPVESSATVVNVSQSEDEREDAIPDQGRGAPETVEEDFKDEMDFVPTIMEHCPVKPREGSSTTDGKVTSVSMTNPYQGIDTKLISVLGYDVEEFDLNSDSDFCVGSYVQFHINYKNYYYTLEKLDNNKIQMWFRASNYAIKGPVDGIIDTKGSGKILLASALRLLHKEPDPEDVEKRWPSAGSPPFFTMIRKVSHAELESARESDRSVDVAEKTPGHFLMSKIVCRFTIANDEVKVTVDGKDWKFNKTQAQRSVAIGRLPTNDIHLKGAAGISRRHSAIVHNKGNWYLIDLGSTNGTYYCGKVLRRGKYDNKNWVALPISSSPVQDGDAEVSSEDGNKKGGDSTTMSTLQREISS